MARELAYALCSKAIRRAIQYCSANDTLTPKREAKKASEGDTDSVVPGSATESEAKAAAQKSDRSQAHLTKDHQDQLRSLVREKFTSAEEAFATFKGKSGTIGRKDFRKMVTQLGMQLNDDERKALRKKVDTAASKEITFEAFSRFIASTVDSQAELPQQSASSQGTRLAGLPSEVPILPPSFRRLVFQIFLFLSFH